MALRAVAMDSAGCCKNAQLMGVVRHLALSAWDRQPGADDCPALLLDQVRPLQTSTHSSQGKRCPTERVLALL